MLYHPPKEEIAELSVLLRNLANTRGLQISSTYRNTNGVGMKISNFRRLDPKYTAEGKVGLAQGSNAEEVIWNEFYPNPELLAETAAAIRLLQKNSGLNPCS